ncbi:MAG: hypothetical protein H0V37_14010 [Chloroflexia bacterium]|nr:hypothetical protein [Chloroflexia bacterium]
MTLSDDPVLQVHMDALAGHDLSRINEANASPNGDGEDEDLQVPIHDFDHLDTRDLSLHEQIVELLYDTQVTKTREGILRWVSSVGGSKSKYGLINGRADRRSWAYAPPNDLLTVLIQLRAIDYKGWSPARGANPEPFSVPEFLEWLEDRFGIIVDRPPAGLGFDGPEHMAAARDNLRAMLRRLRQMGVFEDQSDDFSVQTLTPPYMEPASTDPSAHLA